VPTKVRAAVGTTDYHALRVRPGASVVSFAWLGVLLKR
jgi:hypothetical protein